MADSGIVPLSREEYEGLFSRAARAERQIMNLMAKVEEYEKSKTQNAKAASSPKTQPKAAGGDAKDSILSALETADKINSHELARKLGVDAQVVVGSMKALEAKFQIVAVANTEELTVVTKEGQSVLDKGMSPEIELFNAIPAEGIPMNDLLSKFDKSYKKAGWGNLMKLKLAKSDKKTKIVTRTTDKADDVVLRLLTSLQNGEALKANDYKALKRRMMVEKRKVTSYTMTKGENFGEDLNVLSTVTYEDVQKYTDKDGNWTGPNIKDMNLRAKAELPPLGCLHPLMKVRSSFRQILLEMGFQEMRTNRYVESCFWNFDSLFQPQAHPARDAHDTFFLTQPESSHVPESYNEYFKRVKQTHEDGWKTGSVGHKVPWKPSEAEKNILRTHTTAISARTLYNLAQQRPFKPGKYFSIDRVFRNETIDATHLAEFHQIEGFVIGKGLTLGHLIGTIAEFFKRIGIPDVKFKPAYNPYTEPSMEIFGKKPGKDSWMEVGNSGVFRPEMLQPMGFPPDVTVIAWGLGLERQTMIKYKLQNIRELFGPGVNLSMVQSNPLPYHVISK